MMMKQKNYYKAYSAEFYQPPIVLIHVQKIMKQKKNTKRPTGLSCTE